MRFPIRIPFQRLLKCCILSLLLLHDQCGTVQSQDMTISAPVFNDSSFTCGGIPLVYGYQYCGYNSSYMKFLSPEYSTLYTRQAARIMYKSPVPFYNADVTLEASFSAFVTFSISHTSAHPRPALLGSGVALLIAPDVDTPLGSDQHGLGLLAYNPADGNSANGTDSRVVGIEFDTFMSAGIDTKAVPHVGVDVNSVQSVSAVELGNHFVDTPVGMWVDYNSTLQTILVYASTISRTDGSASSLKPTTPVLTYNNFRLSNFIQHKSYVGLSTSTVPGSWEDKQIFYWSFQTSGMGPAGNSVLAWFQFWFGHLSGATRVKVIAAAVVSTIVTLYCCAEGIFFLFFKRIKKPVTPAEKKWPVRRRTSLPGTKPKKPKEPPPPPKRVRDSLSVVTPLNLWGSDMPQGLTGLLDDDSKNMLLATDGDNQDKKDASKDQQVPREQSPAEHDSSDEESRSISEAPKSGDTKNLETSGHVKKSVAASGDAAIEGTQSQKRRSKGEKRAPEVVPRGEDPSRFKHRASDTRERVEPARKPSKQVIVTVPAAEPHETRPHPTKEDLSTGTKGDLNVPEKIPEPATALQRTKKTSSQDKSEKISEKPSEKSSEKLSKKFFLPAGQDVQIESQAKEISSQLEEQTPQTSPPSHQTQGPLQAERQKSRPMQENLESQLFQKAASHPAASPVSHALPSQPPRDVSPVSETRSLATAPAKKDVTTIAQESQPLQVPEISSRFPLPSSSSEPLHMGKNIPPTLAPAPLQRGKDVPSQAHEKFPRTTPVDAPGTNLPQKSRKAHVAAAPGSPRPNIGPPRAGRDAVPRIKVRPSDNAARHPPLLSHPSTSRNTRYAAPRQKTASPSSPREKTTHSAAGPRGRTTKPHTPQKTSSLSPRQLGGPSSPSRQKASPSAPSQIAATPSSPRQKTSPSSPVKKEVSPPTRRS